MTNYSDQRAQREAARQQQADQNSRDYRRGLIGIDVPSVWGQIGRQHGKQDSTIDDFHADDGLPRTRRGSQPWLPGVDKWVATIPYRVFLILGAIGALGGGFAGMCLLHFLASAFKLAVGLAMIGLAGAAIYYMAVH